MIILPSLSIAHWQAKNRVCILSHDDSFRSVFFFLTCLLKGIYSDLNSSLDDHTTVFLFVFYLLSIYISLIKLSIWQSAF